MNQVSKHKNELQFTDTEQENIVFSTVSQIIKKRKFNAVLAANSQIVLIFWEIGNYVNSVILGMERAQYRKRIVVTLSQQLTEKNGKSFEKTNLTRMM
jgi:hypothetical protein